MKRSKNYIEVRGWVHKDHVDTIKNYQAVMGGRLKRPVLRLEAVGDLVIKGLTLVQMMPKKDKSIKKPSTTTPIVEYKKGD